MAKKTRTAAEHSNPRKGDDLDPKTGLHRDVGQKRDMKRKRAVPLTNVGMPSIVGQKYDVINLAMLQRAAMNQPGFGLRENFKFKKDHFFLTHVLKMRVWVHRGKITAGAGSFLISVAPTHARPTGRACGEANQTESSAIDPMQTVPCRYLAMQVQSNTMHRIVTAEIKKGAAGRMGMYDSRHLPNYQSYVTVLDYIYHINRLVDICNGAKLAEYPVGSGRKPFQPIGSSDDDQLRWLLETLQWFSEWRRELQQDSDLVPAEKRASFLPTETWSAIQSLCLGFNCLTKHYVDPHEGRKLVCRECGVKSGRGAKSKPGVR